MPKKKPVKKTSAAEREIQALLKRTMKETPAVKEKYRDITSPNREEDINKDREAIFNEGKRREF